jgi:hypothetical protein
VLRQKTKDGFTKVDLQKNDVGTSFCERNISKYLDIDFGNA